MRSIYMQDICGSRKGIEWFSISEKCLLTTRNAPKKCANNVKSTFFSKQK